MEQRENNQKQTCKFYIANNRCGITKEYQLICHNKKCTLYINRKERDAVEHKGMA